MPSRRERLRRERLGPTGVTPEHWPGPKTDEFVALTGFHRKHAIRVLNGNSATPTLPRGRRCVYDEAVTEGLIVLWEASDRMCGKRLKALLPILVPARERHGHLSLDAGVRERLLAVSAESSTAE